MRTLLQCHRAGKRNLHNPPIPAATPSPARPGPNQRFRRRSEFRRTFLYDGKLQPIGSGIHDDEPRLAPAPAHCEESTMRTTFSLDHLRGLFTLVALAIAAPAVGRADTLPIVENVEFQPLSAQVRRVMDAPSCSGTRSSPI